MLRFVVVLAAALALSPAQASADAVCTLQFDVRFDGDGRFSQDGAGHGQCAGNVAGTGMDPSAANPTIAGVATGPDCARSLDSGTLTLRPRRAFEMWSPEHLELAGRWRAVGGALDGMLVSGGTAVTLTGALAFAGGCSDRGRMHVHLLLHDERPAGAAAEQPREEESAPASSAPARKAKSRRKRACRSAKSRRAAKRCRRARR